MGTYNITGGNQGAVGDNATAHVFFQSSGLDPSQINAFLEDLDRLRAALLAQPRTDVQVQAVESVGTAVAAARSGNWDMVLSALKSAGQWALDTAKDIGASVAEKVIARQLGL